MKQRTLFLCLILTFAIMFGATACKSNDAETVETTAAQTTVSSIQETTEKETTATKTTDTTATTVSTNAATEATQLTEPTDPLQAEINTAKEDLTAKGWESIEVVQGEPDSLEKWGVLLPSFTLTSDQTLYTVIGNHDVGNGRVTSAVIKIVKNTVTGEATQVETYYVGSNGRNLRGDLLEQFRTNYSKPNELWYATDELLYWIFWNSY